MSTDPQDEGTIANLTATEATLDRIEAAQADRPLLLDGRARDAIHLAEPGAGPASTTCRYAPPVEYDELDPLRLTWTPVITTDPDLVTCAQCSNRLLTAKRQDKAMFGAIESHDVFGALPDAETYDEGTLHKVYDAIAETGLTPGQARDLVNAMQNRGILFRERSDTSVELVATPSEATAHRIGPIPLRHLAVNGLEIPVDMIALGATLHDVSEGILTVTFIDVRTVETIYRYMDQP